MITFSTGIPDFNSLIFVKNIGYCQLESFKENGFVQLYMGAGIRFDVDSSFQWRYWRYQ